MRKADIKLISTIIEIALILLGYNYSASIYFVILFCYALLYLIVAPYTEQEKVQKYAQYPFWARLFIQLVTMTAAFIIGIVIYMLSVSFLSVPEAYGISVHKSYLYLLNMPLFLYC